MEVHAGDVLQVVSGLVEEELNGVDVSIPRAGTPTPLRLAAALITLRCPGLISQALRNSLAIWRLTATLPTFSRRTPPPRRPAVSSVRYSKHPWPSGYPAASRWACTLAISARELSQRSSSRSSPHR